MDVDNFNNLITQGRQKMVIRKVLVSEINPAVYNPRLDLQPGDPDYEKLKKSIATFGYVEPLVWNERTKTLISGHQRLKILIEQGMSEVEVSVVNLSPDQEKALNLALNKIRGNWDEDKLAALLEELKKMPDFDIALTGFDAPEISRILDNYYESKNPDDFDFEAAVESIKEPITQKGDLIELNGHRILCADSTSYEDVVLLMGDDKAHLINCDPPYNIAYLGGNRPNTAKARPKRSRNWERIYSDNLSQEEYEAFLNKVFVNMDKFLMPGCSFYIWNGHNQFAPMHCMLKALNYHIGCVIVWAKPNFAISYGDYHQQTEFCLYGWKEGEKHRWFGAVNESSLWDERRDPTAQYIHPTQKPVALAQRAIRNSSQRGEIVVDFFLGSGSTLIGAESLGRRCFGIEIDPRYCDAIVRRYIAYVGKENVSEELVRKYLPEVANG